MNTADLSTFIEQATPTLRRIAARYSHSPETADDLYQTMAENLISRAQKDPTFTEQKPAYIYRSAQLTALHALRSFSTYRKYCFPIDAQQTDTPSCYTSANMLADPCPSPEKALIEAERAFGLLDALRQLAPRDRAIAKMIFDGYRPSQIAAKLNISRQVVSQRRAVIAKAARAAL